MMLLPTGDDDMNYANHTGYSDVNPYEIIRRVSDKTIEIREMDAVRSNSENKLGFAPGGFVGHCSRQNDQEWTITSNQTYRTIRIRLNKDGRWQDSNGNRYKLADKPRKFYDYNF
jgi:hypothetical protein